MIRYWFSKFACFALSLVLGIALCLLTLSSVCVGLFHGENFIAKGLEQNKQGILTTVSENASRVAVLCGLPQETFDGAIGDTVFNEIKKEVAHNFVYSYNTDFKDDTVLYNAFLNAATEYCSQNGVKASSITLSRSASLAVDYVNEALGGSDTTRVAMFRTVRGNSMMIALVGSAVMVIVSVVGLDLLNRGRHRKFSYIGMGLVTAGYLMTIVPTFIKQKQYLTDYLFCSYAPYDSAVKYCLGTAMKIIVPVGAFLLVGGLVTLVLNYNYFRKKKLAEEQRRTYHESKDSDYMENYNQPSRRGLKPGEEFEKEIRRINFDE